jgi:transposase InsO family protein
MGCLDPESRRLMVNAVRKGYKIGEVAKIFNVSRKTVWKWCKRTMRVGRPVYRDLPKRPHTIHRKVTEAAEVGIVVLREAFNWGTQRIKLYLERPPSYIRTLLESTTGKEWKPIILSRQAINNVLKKHGLNGSPYKSKRNWNYFRASKPDELWQIDIRGPIRIGEIRGYVLVILDDYSRYLVWCKFYERITTRVVLSALSHLAVTRKRKPQKILADNGPQFKTTFENGCKDMRIEVEHTPPYYPQCKGKVERVIRTFNEEFLRVCSVFENSMALMPEFQAWYNDDRYHMGISDFPNELYNNHFDVTYVP